MKTKILILTVSLCLMAFVANAQNIYTNKTPTISVTGTAEIQVVPDTATLSFAVSKKNKSVAAAKKENDETVAKVTDLAKRFGIAAIDVKTDYIRVREATRRVKTQGSNDDYEEVADGFLVSRNLVVKLRDIGKFESFLTALIDAGVNDVGSVVFSSSELRKYKDQARAQAIRAAREKAQAIVGEIGQTIGKAVSIDEENVDNDRNSNLNSNGNTFIIGEVSGADIDAVGTITVKAKVEVSFLLN